MKRVQRKRSRDEVEAWYFETQTPAPERYRYITWSGERREVSAKRREVKETRGETDETDKRQQPEARKSDEKRKRETRDETLQNSRTAGTRIVDLLPIGVMSRQ